MLWLTCVCAVLSLCCCCGGCACGAREFDGPYVSNGVALPRLGTAQMLSMLPLLVGLFAFVSSWGEYNQRTHYFNHYRNIYGPDESLFWTGCLASIVLFSILRCVVECYGGEYTAGRRQVAKEQKEKEEERAEQERVRQQQLVDEQEEKERAKKEEEEEKAEQERVRQQQLVDEENARERAQAEKELSILNARKAKAAEAIKSFEHESLFQPKSAFDKAKHYGNTLMCLWDFASDVIQASVLCADGRSEYEQIGVVAAGVLGVSFVLNLILCQVWLCRNKEINEEASKSHRLKLRLFRFLASTNPEVLDCMLNLVEWPKKLSLQLQIASKDLKQFGLVSQLVEDVPQFIISLAAISSNSTWVWVNLATKLAMLFMKLLGNLLICILFSGNGVASDAVMAHAKVLAKKGQKLPEPTYLCQVTIQGIALALDWGVVVYVICNHSTFWDWARHAHKEDAFDLILGWSIAVLISTFILGLFLVLCFVRGRRDSLWHCALEMEVFTCAVLGCLLDPVAFSGTHPQAVQSMMLFIMPFLRCAYFCAAIIYFIWLDEFFIHQNLLICWGGFNVLALVGMILNFGEAYGTIQDDAAAFTLLDLKDMEDELADVELAGDAASLKLTPVEA